MHHRCEMREQLSVRFWSKVDKKGADECWPWTAAKANKGYGTIGIGGRGSGNIGAHRLSYILNIGQIPDGKIVCHKCDNPPCCNPAHLFLGTHKDNTQDMMQKGRCGPSNKPHLMARGDRNCMRLYPKLIKRGSQQTNSKLSDADIPIIRNSTRPQRVLAREYGVDQALIYRIKARKSWAHIQ